MHRSLLTRCVAAVSVIVVGCWGGNSDLQDAQEAITVIELYADADVKIREAQPNNNFQLKGLEATPGWRSLVGFIEGDVVTQMSGRLLVRATLRFQEKFCYMLDPFDIPVHAHRMTRSWAESATWACADDDDPSNAIHECDPANEWQIDGPNYPFDTVATGTGICNDTSVNPTDIDVTADVADFLRNGGDLSWLIRAEEFAAYGDRENGFAPILRLETIPDTYVPADPASTAPTLDRTVTTGVLDSAKFLVQPATGDPVQWGTVPGAITEGGASVLHGIVRDTTGTPLTGVDITVLHHPEYGQTRTRVDGRFDLLVDGGRELTLDYQKSGYSRAQRSIDIGRAEHLWAPDVALLADPAPDLGAGATHCDRIDATNRLFLSAETADVRTFGPSDPPAPRRTLVYVPAGVRVQGDGVGPATDFQICALEYTVDNAAGEGEEAMPSELPPSSAYTYAAEYSALQYSTGDRIGAPTFVDGSGMPADVYIYVDNFLGFPPVYDDATGPTAVPAGYYDYALGQWFALGDGVVVTVDKSSVPCTVLADGAVPPGLTTAERDAICTHYSSPSFPNTQYTVWRVPVRHFTPLDFNWAGDPSGMQLPRYDPNDPPSEPCPRSGSIIGCEDRTIGEVVPVTGAPFDLTYQSGRQLGRREAYAFTIPVLPDAPSPEYLRTRLRVDVEGQSHSVEIFSDGMGSISSVVDRDRRGASAMTCAGSTCTFRWDGLDLWGRRVQGRRRATVLISYIYGASYGRPSGAPRSFATPEVDGDTTFSIMSTGPELHFRTIVRDWLGELDDQALGFGGWRLSSHHLYDPDHQILYYGDGTTRMGAPAGDGVERVLGGGSSAAEGAPPLSVASGPVRSIAFGIDGTLYYVENTFPNPGLRRVRRLRLDGTVDTLLGNTGDPGLLTVSNFTDPRAVAVDRAGRIFVANATASNSSIYVIHPPSIGGAWTVDCFAGACLPGSPLIGQPVALAVASDGGVWLSDALGDRVVALAPSEASGTYVAESIAADHSKPDVAALTVDRRGRVYVATRDWTDGVWGYRVERIHPDGRSEIIASVGSRAAREGSVTHDAGGVSESSLPEPIGMAIGPDGWVYMASEAGTPRITRFDPDAPACPDGACAGAEPRRTWTVVGPSMGSTACVPEWRAAAEGTTTSCTAALSRCPTGAETVAAHCIDLTSARGGLAFSPDGRLYFAGQYLTTGSGDDAIGRLVPLAPPRDGAELQIPESDGSVLYIFSPAGRHLRTVDAVTGRDILTFDYGPDGYVDGITDQYGQTTTLARTVSSVVVGSPFGTSTTLTLADWYGSGDRYLTQVVHPDPTIVHNITYVLGLDPQYRGLLNTFAFPNGETFGQSFDSEGYLLLETDPRGYQQQLVPVTPPIAIRDAIRDVVWALDFGSDPALLGEAGSRADEIVGRGSALTHRTPLDANLDSVADDYIDTVYFASRLRNAAYRVTHEAGTQPAVARYFDDGLRQMYTSNGGFVEIRLAPDPRFGHIVAYADEILTRRPSGHATLLRFTRTVDVSGPRPPGALLSSFVESVQPLAETAPGTFAALSDPETRRLEWDGMGGVWLEQSEPASGAPERTRTVHLDTYGRPVRVIGHGQYDRTFSYDSAGRLLHRAMGPPSSPLQRNDQYFYSAGAGQFLDAIQSNASGVASFTSSVTARTPMGWPTETNATDLGWLGQALDGNGAAESQGAAGFDVSSFPIGNGFQFENFSPSLSSTTLGTVQYSYDATGDMRWRILPSGPAVAWTLEPGTGRMQRVEVLDGSGVVSFGTMTYASDGRIDEMVLDHDGSPGTTGDQSSIVFGGAGMGETGDERWSAETTWGLPALTHPAAVTYHDREQRGWVTRLGSRLLDSGGGYVAEHHADYQYDQDGVNEIIDVNAGAAGTVQITFDRTITSTGVQTKIGVGAGITTTIDTDGFGDISKIVVENGPAGGGVVYQYDVTTMDGAGRPLETYEELEGLGGRDQTYTYDAAGRLVSWQDLGLSASESYSYTGHRRVSGRGTGTVQTDALYSSYVYDAAGMLEEARGWTFAYDPFHSLLSASDGSTSIEYRVDPIGRRIARLVDGQLTDRFIYQDELNPIGWIHRDPSTGNEKLAWFVYGSQLHVPDLMLVDDAGGGYDGVVDTAYRLVTDVRGSVVAVVEITGGSVEQTITYDAWGTATLQSGSDDLQPFRFAGGLWDPATELVRFGARDYDPYSGRWTTPDPIGFGGGLDLYAYADNNPVGVIDPAGTCGNPISGLIIGAAMSIAFQLADNGGRWDCVDWGEVAGDALFDAATFGVGCMLHMMMRGMRGLAYGARLGGRFGARGFGGALRGGGAACRGGVCAPGSGACFGEGTLVETPDGPVPIELVRPGDMVAAGAADGVSSGYYPVEEVHVTTNAEVIRLGVQGGLADEFLLVTPEHPFWHGERGWTPARLLRVGDELFTSTGAAVAVSSVSWEGRQTTYNLSVEVAHTFLVGASQIVVHNANCGSNLGVPGDDFVPNPNINSPYSRPPGAGPNAAQTASVQGVPCTGCSTITPNQVADHIDPLVVEYYRTGTNNIARQSGVDAVQAHCPSCSRRQGGLLSGFSRRMRRLLGI